MGEDGGLKGEAWWEFVVTKMLNHPDLRSKILDCPPEFAIDRRQWALLAGVRSGA